MFAVRYTLAELRRRRGRTLTTILGLAVGVALVAVVAALGRGLDDAQERVLEPLTGLGTDMSVTRPLRITDDGRRFVPDAAGANLSPAERRELLRENRAAQIELSELGDPGDRFATDVFVSSTQLSFPADTVSRITRIPGVAAAAPGLSLAAIHLEGDVPEAAPGPGGDRLGPSAVLRGNIDVQTATIAGVDVSRPDLGLVTPAQIGSGRFLSPSPRRARSEVILSQAYAGRQGIGVGDRLRFRDTSFTVVGLARPPIGGQATDVYAEIDRLQELAGRRGRINAVQVRAVDADSVPAVAARIEAELRGGQVTTSADLAAGVGGSLLDASRLADSLGVAIAVVAAIAAALIASLLTLASVAKRTRELGTLKAIGWRGRLVVRQVAAETLVLGLLGGLIGAGLAAIGSRAIEAVGPTLRAEAGQTQPSPLAFGQGRVAPGSTEVALEAPVDLRMVFLAVGLALAASLVAAVAGGWRAARLRPAEALRAVE